MIKACIFNIQRYSLHDGGGIRTIVFFKGCPFHCPWCCNPESLSTSPQLFYKASLCMNCSKKVNGMCEVKADMCPTGAKEIIGEMKSVDEVFEVVKRDYPFYEASQGGVTLSGGECFLQPEFALALLKKCKEHNIATAIETTLATPIANCKEFVTYCDCFLVDFKIMNEKKSKTITGISTTIRNENIKALVDAGANIIARIPLIPTFTTTSENINEIISFLKQYHINEVHLLPFHQLGESKYKSINKDYTCHDLATLSEEEITQIVQLFQDEGFKTILHGK